MKRLGINSAAAAILCVGTALAGGAGWLCSAAQAAATIPVVIDTDMAPDDWMAILYLASRPDVDLLAVTVAGDGESHCKPGVTNAMALLALGGRPDVKVACGPEKPLVGANSFPKDWRKGVDAMAGIKLPKNPNPPPKTDAVSLLKDTLAKSEGKVIVVTLGPLTNIAALLRAEPDAKDHIAAIWSMAGALDVPGNLHDGIKSDNKVAEWNVFIDPVAADEVLSSGIPVTLVALDATNKLPLDAAFYDRLKQDHKSPSADFVYKMIGKQMGFLQSGNWYFWDPLAAVLALDEGLATYTTDKLRVTTTPGKELGRVVRAGDGQSVRVTTNVDKEKFEAEFLQVLRGAGN